MMEDSQSSNEFTELMDLLNVDEEKVDERILLILSRLTFQQKHLRQLRLLLRYKLMIYLAEPDEELTEKRLVDFLPKLIENIENNQSVELLGEIIRLVLQLQSNNLPTLAEYLLQQLLCMISDANETSDVRVLNILKIIDNVLIAVLQSHLCLSLPLGSMDFNGLLYAPRMISNYYMAQIIPKLTQILHGSSILSLIWEQFDKDKPDADFSKALNALCCLSDYYLPITESDKETEFQSNVIYKPRFWEIINFGVRSYDQMNRKMALYLFKRAIDCAAAMNKTIDVFVQGCRNFVDFTNNEDRTLTSMQWQNFFILFESLEESQSNIVLPALGLFQEIELIPSIWLRSALARGLLHESETVVRKCIEITFKHRLHDTFTADDFLILCKSLNNMNIFENCNTFLTNSWKTTIVSQNFLLACMQLKWTAVPLYYISKTLAEVDTANVSFICDLKMALDFTSFILNTSVNNVALRKAIHTNTLYFMCHILELLAEMKQVQYGNGFLFDTVSIEDFVQVISNIPRSLMLSSCLQFKLVKILKLFPKEISLMHTNFGYNSNSIKLWLDSSHFETSSIIISDFFQLIADINDRQYGRKTEQIPNFKFLNVISSIVLSEPEYYRSFLSMIVQNVGKLLHFIIGILTEADDQINVIDLQIGELIKQSLKVEQLQNILAKLLKTCQFLLRNSNNLYQCHFALKIFAAITSSKNNMHFEYLKPNDLIEIYKNIELVQYFNEQDGRKKTIFNNSLCEALHNLLQVYKMADHNDLLKFVLNIQETGGPGCLEWSLRIIKIVLPYLKDTPETYFNQLLMKSWLEIGELKSNENYKPCMKVFISILVDDLLVQKNVDLVKYGFEIIQVGETSNVPVAYLTEELLKRNKISDKKLVELLAEILMYCPVPKKDQKITDQAVSDVLKQHTKYASLRTDTYKFDDEIRGNSVILLRKVEGRENLDYLQNRLKLTIETVVKKKRYHGGGVAHRLLLSSLQHLLSIEDFYGSEKDLMANTNWLLEVLGSVPHQPSVKICLEWAIAIILSRYQDLEEIINQANFMSIPLLSQFMIMYLVVKTEYSFMKSEASHFSSNQKSNLQYVLDFMLPHTMGPNYSHRLHSQFLCLKLFSNYQSYENLDAYKIVMNTIERNFNGCKEKGYEKIKADFVINKFDILANWDVENIYNILPRVTELQTDVAIENCYLPVDDNCIERLKRIDHPMCSFITKHLEIDKTVSHHEVENQNTSTSINIDTSSEFDKSGHAITTLQKKYIPWSHMEFVETSRTQRGKESGLIVVGSLVDKAANLGGIARSAEVFAVKSYVLSSAAHLQHNPLSMSAERWLPVEEVRPGPLLKEYLAQKRREGYTVVAAEQTSASQPLHTYTFPYRTVLLLGAEKEGVPCDLLALCDTCVEVPQLGRVRSLNVHVTAAICIWRYVTTHLL